MATRHKIPNVHQVKGKTYFRYKDGGPRPSYISLPAPNSPHFAAAYAAAVAVKNEKLVERAPAATGTFNALIAEYRASAGFKAMRAVTRENNIYYLDMFGARFGARRVKDLTPAQVDHFQDEMQATPGKANAYISKLRTLLNFAVRRGYRHTNPAIGVKPLKLGEHQPWSQDIIARALAAGDDMDKLIIITGLCSGQRISDCVQMRHDQIDDKGRMPLIQQKTGKRVLIPVHPIWRAAIERVEMRAETLIYDSYGRPYARAASLGVRVHKLLVKAGVSGVSFHGLRKTATNFLTELGLSPGEIGVITGMSIEMVQHYTRNIDQSRILDLIEGRVRAGSPIRG